jgi:alpha 1,2-mannosyltransferase
MDTRRSRRHSWKHHKAVADVALALDAAANRTRRARLTIQPPSPIFSAGAIAASAKGYPRGIFEGRGVVMVGGGPYYSPPAYACLVFLRKTGSSLPVEVWVPPHEEMPDAIAREFQLHGAAVRSLADFYPEEILPRLHGYITKPAAIIASSFEEVLFLDADNIPLKRPDFLFQHPLYTTNGLLMWPDFWPVEVQPGTWEFLHVLPSLWPKASHESGQIVLNKRVGWEPLMLTLYFNLLGDIFYPMFSIAGQGDKETYPFAFLALGKMYGIVPHRVVAVGYLEYKGVNATDPEHKGTAMLQRDPEGLPQFLHVHLPKVDLNVSGPFEDRKWLIFSHNVTELPMGLSDDLKGSYRLLNAVAGMDVEVELHLLRQSMRCHPAWAKYVLQPPVWLSDKLSRAASRHTDKFIIQRHRA